MKLTHWIVLLIAGWISSLSLAAEEPRSPLIGVDANYAAELEGKGVTWSRDGVKDDVFSMLAKAGANAFRVRLWTGDEGTNGLRYATETAKRAQKAGLKPYLVIFLSENWADYVKQPAPAAWKDLDDAAKAKAIEAYAERVARHFAEAGVPIDVFEIGNEIDFGICGIFEEEWAKRVSIEYMRERIWSRMAPLIAAAQRGVRKVRPEAKFILHLTQWSNAPFCVAFWKTMEARGVAVDYPGLSYFPTSATAETNSLAFLEKQLALLHKETGKPIMICEYAFPAQPKFAGQFADWNKPVEGYALDEAGQQRWLTDFLALVRVTPHIAGAYYWSPEWLCSGMWEAFALFDEQGAARPALGAFTPAPNRQTQSPPDR